MTNDDYLTAGFVTLWSNDEEKLAKTLPLRWVFVTTRPQHVDVSDDAVLVPRGIHRRVPVYDSLMLCLSDRTAATLPAQAYIQQQYPHVTPTCILQTSIIIHHEIAYDTTVNAQPT